MTWFYLTWLYVTWFYVTWLYVTWLYETWLYVTWFYLTWFYVTWLYVMWLYVTWFYLHDGVEAGLEAAQMLLLHLDALRDLLLGRLRLAVFLRQPSHKETDDRR